MAATPLPNTVRPVINHAFYGGFARAMRGTCHFAILPRDDRRGRIKMHSGRAPWSSEPRANGRIINWNCFLAGFRTRRPAAMHAASIEVGSSTGVEKKNVGKRNSCWEVPSWPVATRLLLTDELGLIKECFSPGVLRAFAKWDLLAFWVCGFREPICPRWSWEVWWDFAICAMREGIFAGYFGPCSDDYFRQYSHWIVETEIEWALCPGKRLPEFMQNRD